ncbi:MAG: DUF429 domain-containing protein [Candidatus Caldarchaeum sp.]
MAVVFLGVDLAGSVRRPSGMALLDEELSCRTWVRFSDDAIIADVEVLKPAVVGVDAPLGLPRGRESLEEPGPPHFRLCDIELRRRRIKFFPITIGPMRMLTARGMKLAAALRQKGVKVYETYPGGVQDVLGLPRKQQGVAKLVKGLRKLGVKGLSTKITGDEVDAVTCALAAYMWWRGLCEELGNPDEGVIILPKPTGVREAVGIRRKQAAKKDCF